MLLSSAHFPTCRVWAEAAARHARWQSSCGQGRNPTLLNGSKEVQRPQRLVDVSPEVRWRQTHEFTVVINRFDETNTRIARWDADDRPINRAAECMNRRWNRMVIPSF